MTKEEIKQLFKTGNRVLITDALKKFFAENHRRQTYQAPQQDIIAVAQEIFK